MKIRFYLMVMAVAVTAVLGMSSCSSDDDETAEAVASQVVGSYTGNEVVMVMGEESSNGTSTYGFSKATDISVDMATHSFDDMAHRLSSPLLSLLCPRRRILWA